MSNLFKNHFEEIRSIFIENYRKELNKSIELKFEHLIYLLQSHFSNLYFPETELNILKEWFNNVYHQSFLDKLLCECFEEIIFHSSNDIIIKNISVETIDCKLDMTRDDFQLMLETLARKNNIEWNYATPFTSFNIKNSYGNFRFTLIHESTGPIKQSKLFIRKNELLPMNLTNFCEDVEIQSILKNAIQNKFNIIIAGKTGSGKTTLLKSLINEINSNEHVIIIEDTNEINFEKSQFTFLKSNEEESKKSAKAYCSYSMRMNPDRLIIGELRSNEVIPFLLSMNTGHRGLLSTIHANSAKDVINRLYVLFSLYSDLQNINSNFIREIAARNIDLIIYMENKKIKEIVRPICMEEDTLIAENLFIAI